MTNFAANMKEVVVKDSDLQKAALEGMDAFIKVFTDAIREAVGGELTAEAMSELNADQITLLTWDMLHEEVMDGGFVQLIHNGLGEFIFKNPVKSKRNFTASVSSFLYYTTRQITVKNYFCSFF